uniref:Pentatricopeptide repeat-containing protein n=1 Tax=Cannabis sativa TaxID=3483 RepID=A0A803Q3T2_CANSA
MISSKTRPKETMTKNGREEEAVMLFCKCTHQESPTPYVFRSILRTCTAVGQLDLGEQIHTQALHRAVTEEALQDTVQKPGEKNEVSWNAMITGYSQHGLSIEALNLFEQMKQLRSDSKPCVTFVGVLSACSHVGFG